MNTETMTDEQALDDVRHAIRHSPSLQVAYDHIAARLRGEGAQPEQQGQAVACHLCDGGVKKSRTGSVWCEACNRTGYRPQPVGGDAVRALAEDFRDDADDCKNTCPVQASTLLDCAERLECALSTQPAPSAPVRDREADRARFPDKAFNDWLDDAISDGGHIVWHGIGDVCDAWHGWEAHRLASMADEPMPWDAPAPSEEVAAATTGRLPPLPQAFFDEFGIGADDRVQDYARAAVAQCRPEQVAACLTCGDRGWIGGPTYQDPAEGGIQCPDCDALEQVAASVAVPEGWALVPAKPTEAMIHAGGLVVDDGPGVTYEDDASATWAAMLAAAPKPTAGEVQTPRRTLYIDLDGVMADFDGSFPAVFGLDHRSMADEDMWLRINGHASFFRDLPPMDGAIEFFRSVEHVEPVILTACPKSNYAHVAGQKRAWVRQHLSGTCLVLPVLGGRHKALFMHQPGDVLIDDWGKNCDAWTEAGGIAIKHEGDWNATRAALTAALAQQASAEGRNDG